MARRGFTGRRYFLWLGQQHALRGQRLAGHHKRPWPEWARVAYVRGWIEGGRPSDYWRSTTITL